MINIYVDADSSPVKNETVRVAKRYGLKVYFVSNNPRMRVPEYKLGEVVAVNDDLDAADDWIVEHITANDVVISADIPLVARCIKKGSAGPRSQGTRLHRRVDRRRAFTQGHYDFPAGHGEPGHGQPGACLR